MKNSIKGNFHSISSPEDKGNEKLPVKKTFSSNAFTSTMTEKLVAPPARVWEKIEKILDEQDNRRNNADKMIASSFLPKKPEAKKRTLYLATAAGLSVAVGVIWIIL